MIDILTGLGATKTGLELVKTVRDMLKGDKFDRIKVLEHLGSVQDALLDAREALGNAQDLNRDLTRQLEERRRLSDIEADMEYVSDGGFYVRKSERTAGRMIPYCPICWKADRKDIPLNPLFGEGYYRCDVHNSNYETAAYRRRGGTPNPSNYDEL
jgi:hypothetical protein